MLLRYCYLVYYEYVPSTNLLQHGGEAIEEILRRIDVGGRLLTAPLTRRWGRTLVATPAVRKASEPALLDKRRGGARRSIAGLALRPRRAVRRRALKRWLRFPLTAVKLSPRIKRRVEIFVARRVVGAAK